MAVSLIGFCMQAGLLLPGSIRTFIISNRGPSLWPDRRSADSSNEIIQADHLVARWVTLGSKKPRKHPTHGGGVHGAYISQEIGGKRDPPGCDRSSGPDPRTAPSGRAPPTLYHQGRGDVSRLSRMDSLWRPGTRLHFATREGRCRARTRRTGRPPTGGSRPAARGSRISDDE